MNRNADDMFRTLRPSGLDTAVAESHARRREQDLANALNDARPGLAVPVTTARRRMPRVLIAGLAAGAVAATAAGVIVASDGSGRSGGVRPTASGTGQALDARTVLLASAETVARTPATTGAYWYVRERETGLVQPDTAIDKATAKRLAAKGRVLKSAPITASVSKTEESWDGRNRHDRTITGIDPKITFASPAEEAKWKRMSPAERRRWDLDVSGKPQVSNYDFSKVRLSPTQRDQSIEQLTKLPTDVAALERVMRKWYKDENQESTDHDGVPTGDSFALSVFGNAQDLLAGPLTPGTKAALYRVLAKQPGIRYLGTATDPMGRKGAVLAMGSGDDAQQAKSGGEIRLIIDPKTGQLLAQESGDRKAPMLIMTYEAMGWVKSLGARP
ncbi:CU044_5270 family protein [Actinoallomurus purpureus]|uniref:CU044_5270 family protein n=1 Tax=Actinoallomurus purpureus TaxID=478114 RepID=UPI00209387BB|nr:CU044_5270 family protein [Actinoallomurus purpureus]MCO6004387.1 CU044_5270 family protein [Actinoallomurus purpureus]